ncbi:NUDIX hydrolase YfcD [Thorsellia anophelis]|nr:NUDIX hydrolase YfcD [Thorsellia anophelis]
MVEWVDIIAIDEVTGEQAVIGQSTRSAMRLHKLLHKATYLIVHDSNNNILVQKRTMNKDYYPGYWDAAAGGVVQENEDWYVSMKREAEEELGITDIPFVDHGEFYFTDEEHYILGRLYSCIATGPFALQSSEIEQVDWVGTDDIFNRQSEFTPDSIFALTKWNSRNDLS